MFPVFISNPQKQKELEEEIELLQQSANLGKDYYRRKYQLELKKRQRGVRDLYISALIFTIIIAVSIIYDFSIAQLSDFPISVILVPCMFIAYLLQWFVFIRQFTLSEAKYIQRVKTKLARQYQANRE